MSTTRRRATGQLRIDWKPVITRAAEIVGEYETAVTLRQLHYRLVSTPGLGYPNTLYAYKRLSDLTAEGRREGAFPALADLTRSIAVPHSYTSAAEALSETADEYRRDRTEGQRVVPVVIAEKATLLAQLVDWFGDALGIPIVALRGYSSESYERDVREFLDQRGRSFRALVLGDFDSSGEDIERNARRYLGESFDSWERVAVTPGQVTAYRLPESIGKDSDPRSKAFEARHGKLVQVEVEALDPDVLRDLIQAAIVTDWDVTQHQAVLDREGHEREQLRKLSEDWEA